MVRKLSSRWRELTRWREGAILPLLFLCVGALTACYVTSPEPSPWTLEFDSGTTVHEYEVVSAKQRAGRQIDAIEDLRIRGTQDSDEGAFFRVRGIAVDEDGNIYVLDDGDYHVHVFDHSGTHVRTLGRKGQGPGEFQDPTAIAVAGDRLVVSDGGTKRLISWTLDGQHVSDSRLPGSDSPIRLFGMRDGSIIAEYAIIERQEKGTQVWRTLRHLAPDGTRLRELYTLPVPYVNLSSLSITGNQVTIRVPVTIARPHLVVTQQGEIYVSTGSEYQVLALELTGAAKWALRVPWSRAPVLPDEIERAFSRVRARAPDVAKSDIDWPELLPALPGMRVDGHGHLYVFPDRRGIGGTLGPVDVYSPDGSRVFAGKRSGRYWEAASGDYVYEIQSNQQADEVEVVRYRLVEPF